MAFPISPSLFRAYYFLLLYGLRPLDTADLDWIGYKKWPKLKSLLRYWSPLLAICVLFLLISI